MTYREPLGHELDQVKAGVRDLLQATELELVDASFFDPGWLAEHSADDLLELFMTASRKAGPRGALITVYALEVGPGRVAHVLLILSKPMARAVEESP